MRHTKTNIHLLSLGLSLVGLVALCPTPTHSAQNQKPVFPKAPITGKLAPPPKGRGYWEQQKKISDALGNDAWVYTEWTRNDGPYAATRAQIERAFSTGTQPQVTVSQYEAAAKREPNNAFAQFAWAYAVRLATKSPSFHISNVQDLVFSANVALAEAPSPHTYDYDRLRYLLWIQFGGGGASHFLKGMAVRLLQKDPHDFPVLLDQTLIYTQNRDKAARHRGYALIQRLIHQYPGKPDVYDALGCWYYTEYMFEHDPKNYRLAISTYQKALAMYPTDSVRRGQLPAVMAELTRRFHQISGG